MAPYSPYSGLEFEQVNLSPPPQSSVLFVSKQSNKDHVPSIPIRKLTPVNISRTMLRVNRKATSIARKDSPSATISPSDVKETAVGYGYGDAVPDSEMNKTEDVYGYGSASPDVSKKSVPSDAVADMYGYGSGSPDVARENIISENTDHYRTATATNFQYDGTRVPRRSSLKACSSYGGEPIPGSSNHGAPRRSLQRRNSAIEVRVRGEDGPVRRRRSIDFANKVHVKEVEPVKAMTEDVRSLWLQADDFAQMKEHRRSLLEKYKERQRQASIANVDGNQGFGMMAPPFSSLDHSDEGNLDDSFRGLERYIDKSGRRQKNVAWDAVLLEQDEQECCGYYDEHRIAEMYRVSTQESPEKAFLRAQQDQEAVQEYLTSPRTAKLMAKSRFKFMRRVSC